MRTQEEIMADAGYVTASRAAKAVGYAQTGTIHTMLKDGRLTGARAGTHWYVSVKSLIDAHKDAPPIVACIRALGVEPKDTPPTPKGPGVKKAKARSKGGSRARNA